MPAKSKAQRRLFALALLYKRGELSASKVSDEIIELSKLPETTLRDYAETKEDNLPDTVEETVNLNPNMNVQSMNNPSFPTDPGSSSSFFSQTPGSGDISLNKKGKKRKKINLLSFNAFLYEMKMK
jgi:hypothetical protein